MVLRETNETSLGVENQAGSHELCWQLEKKEGKGCQNISVLLTLFS